MGITKQRRPILKQTLEIIIKYGQDKRSNTSVDTQTPAQTAPELSAAKSVLPKQPVATKADFGIRDRAVAEKDTRGQKSSKYESPIIAKEIRALTSGKHF